MSLSPRLAGIVTGAALGVLLFAAPPATASPVPAPVTVGVQVAGTPAPTLIGVVLPQHSGQGVTSPILRPMCLWCHIVSR